MSEKQEHASAYWKENIKYLFILLAIWFAVSYGAGILFKESLNEIKIGGFELGFWFAQQGSIYAFVILIFVYVRLMNKLDKKWTPGYQRGFPVRVKYTLPINFELEDDSDSKSILQKIFNRSGN